MNLTSKQIALGGIFSALSLVFMILSGVLPLPYVMVFAAGFMVMLISAEVGIRAAFCAYVVVALLSLMLAPNRAMAVSFMLFFGYYPLLKQKLERLPTRKLEYACKVAVCVLSGALSTLASLHLFGAAAAVGGLHEHGLPVLVGGTALGFFVYDFILTSFYTAYIRQLRPKIWGGAK